MSNHDFRWRLDRDFWKRWFFDHRRLWGGCRSGSFRFSLSDDLFASHRLGVIGVALRRDFFGFAYPLEFVAVDETRDVVPIDPILSRLNGGDLVDGFAEHAVAISHVVCDGVEL